MRSFFIALFGMLPFLSFPVALDQVLIAPEEAPHEPHGRYLSINGPTNRADRRSHSKLRRSAPGAFGPNQRQRIHRWRLQSIAGAPPQELAVPVEI